MDSQVKLILFVSAIFFCPLFASAEQRRVAVIVDGSTYVPPGKTRNTVNLDGTYSPAARAAGRASGNYYPSEKTLRTLASQGYGSFDARGNFTTQVPATAAQSGTYTTVNNYGPSTTIINSRGPTYTTINQYGSGRARTNIQGGPNHVTTNRRR